MSSVNYNPTDVVVQQINYFSGFFYASVSNIGAVLFGKGAAGFQRKYNVPNIQIKSKKAHEDPHPHSFLYSFPFEVNLRDEILSLTMPCHQGRGWAGPSWTFWYSARQADVGGVLPLTQDALQ